MSDALPEDIDAAHALREKVLDDARRLRRAARLLGHGTIAVVLGLHLIATSLVAWVVFTEPFPYPVMYVLNGILLWLVLAIRFMALLDGRRVSAVLWLVVNLVLHAFWVWVLSDQVPARPIVTGQVVARLTEPWLWVPIGIYVVTMAGMLAHAAIHLRHERLSREHEGA